MKNLASPESTPFSGNLSQSLSNHFSPIADKDDFISNYTSKLLAGEVPDTDSGESATASWIKKKISIENLLRALLTQEKEDGYNCDFLLRILRAANMVDVSTDDVAEVEKRISRRLDEASLEELMIPCFRHTGNTLLDVGLVLRLVKGFLNSEKGGGGGGRESKVAKLVDEYSAEVALDAQLELPEFMELLTVVPGRARQSDDGLYRAIDTYLKAHPLLSKQDKKNLCSLIDNRKLSEEATLHAIQNERLPVRTMMHFLLTHQIKLKPDGPTSRCLLWREMLTQQNQIKRLNQEILRLQTHCVHLEMTIEKLLEKKGDGYCVWIPFGLKSKNVAGDSAGFRHKSPPLGKMSPVTGSSSTRWRDSMY